MERLKRTYKDEGGEPLAMSATDLLPKWSSSPDGIAMPTRNKSTIPTKNSRPFWSILTEKSTWHSRISDLFFLSLLLGIGATFGVFATVRYMANPDVIGLSSYLPTNFTASSGDNPESPSNSSDELAVLGLMPYPVDLSDLSDVYHDMSDAELLRVATVDGARRRREPEGASPKVAYMFLARGPLPLAPLWERYFEGHEDLYSVYIHSHPNFLPNYRPNSVFYRRNIPSKEAHWAALSLVAAERRLLANALLNAAIERFVLVSDSCIPVTPFPVAYRYMVESEHSFVESYIDESKAGIGRYYRVKHFRELRPEIRPEQWRKGSQWFEMSRELALTVVADVTYYPKFASLVCSGENHCYSEEHYLPTMLSILAPSKLANRTTTDVQFRRRGAHPYEWKTPDVTALSMRNVTTGQNCTYNGRITDKCLLFARKFAPGTIKPLLELATASFGIP